MDKMEFKTRDEISTLVPHKGKMLLLDRIQGFNLQEITITTQVDISADCMFYSEELGGVPSYVAFEYMAQSISALSGIHGRSCGKSPKEGFIMSVSNCKAELTAFKPGDVVEICVKQTMRMDMAVTFDGVASVGGKQVLSATLSTVEVEDAKSIIDSKE
jgi:predicted hotdog family 3-hydroxylacyl-ACP dehydratase